MRDIRGIGPKRYEVVVSILRDKNQTLDDLFKMNAHAIKTSFKLPIRVAEAIAIQGTRKPIPKTEDDLLAEKQVTVLKRDSDAYPENLKTVLGDKAPETLYVWGNLDLLSKPAVGFCGSRNATQKGANRRSSSRYRFL